MVSFDSPEYVANVDGLGTLRILRQLEYRFNKKTRVSSLHLNCMEDWQK
jgi:GDP-D-mannose dehydratase